VENTKEKYESCITNLSRFIVCMCKITKISRTTLLKEFHWSPWRPAICRFTVADWNCCWIQSWRIVPIKFGTKLVRFSFYLQPRYWKYDNRL